MTTSSDFRPEQPAGRRPTRLHPVWALGLLVPTSAWALDPPHDASNSVSCSSCHAMHADSPTGWGLLPRGALQEAMCKSCHNPTGKAAEMAEVANHVVGGGTIVDCGSCHDPHRRHTTADPHPGGQTAPNLKLIRGDTGKYTGGSALEPALFQQRPAHFAFDDSDPPWDGICQSCHTETDHHRNDATADHHHQMGLACTTCHPHETGFLPQGGCLDCHDQPQGARRQIAGAGGDFERPSHHVAGMLQDSDCTACHHVADHQSGTVKLKDPDAGESVLYSFSPSDPAGLENFCLNCHDGDGAAAGGGTYPFSEGGPVPDVEGGSENAWAGSAHKLRGYAANGGNPISCFGDGSTSGCHGNAHGSNNEKLLEAPTGMPLDQFCNRCHTDGLITNVAISGSSLADDIEQAFTFASANQHDLGAAFTIGASSYTLQCTTCHNPHVATGTYWEADQNRSPVTRPDFSDPTNNSRAMGTTLWGDEPGEKLADYAGSGTYRTPNGDVFTADELPDYNTFCGDCHEAMPDPSSQAGAHGQLQFSADAHGHTSANVPNGGGVCPNWYACGKAARWDGDDCVGSQQECWPVVPRGKGEQIWSRSPYNQEDRISGANFVLSCTDCHEGHGSTVRSLIRPNPNDGTGTTIWNTMCNNCHYYYSDWHAGMACANASCHVSDGSDRMYWTGTDTLHRMGHRYGDGSTRIFEPDLVLDLRFENNLKDSGTWRLHGVWSLARPNPSQYGWCEDDPAKAGSFVTGRVGKAIEIDDQPIEVGTEDCSWSTDEGQHGTWKYTEMKYSMTLEAWVYPTADDGERKILAKHTYGDGGYALVLKQLDGRLRTGLLVNVTGGGPNWGTGGWDAADCNGLRGAYSAVSIPLNQWTHVAATYDSSGPDRDPSDGSVGRMRIYLDGEDVTASYPTVDRCFTQPGSGEIAMFPYSDHSPGNESICYDGHWCASALSVGGLNWSAPADNFSGRLDEVKVWNITKPASYFSAADAMAPPRIDSVSGRKGSNELLVRFSEGVFGSGPGGALAPGDFVLTTFDGKSIASVIHNPGEASATLVLDAPLTAEDMTSGVTLAAVASSIGDDYANYASDAYAVSITWASCLDLPTAFQFGEPGGSATVTDDEGFYRGAVSDPPDTLAGDGYYYGDGLNNFIDFENYDTCLQVSRELTIEARLRPSGIGTDNYVKRVLARDTGGNYQLSVWRNVGWDTYNPPAGVASLAFWLKPVDARGGKAWKLALTDHALCPVVSDHWYLAKVVWNSAKTGGIPADIFVDDQGALGDDAGESWAGYINCTDATQSELPADRFLYQGDEIATNDGDFAIGANVNNHASNVFSGQIDWIIWQGTVDYSGVDDPPVPPQG